MTWTKITPNSRESLMHLSFDYVQEAYYPNNPLQLLLTSNQHANVKSCCEATLK